MNLCPHRMESPNSFLGHPQKMYQSDVWELSNTFFLLRYPRHLWWFCILGLSHRHWDQVVELFQGQYSCILYQEQPQKKKRKKRQILTRTLWCHTFNKSFNNALTEPSNFLVMVNLKLMDDFLLFPSFKYSGS